MSLSIYDMVVLTQQAIFTADVRVDPDLEIDEILLQLNRAQSKLIDGLLNPVIRRELLDGGIDIDQVNSDALRNLYQENIALDKDTDFGEGVIYNLKDNYYHKIEANVVLSDDNCDDVESNVNIRFIEKQEKRQLLNHPFGKTSKESLIGIITGNKLKIYTPEGSTIKNVYLDYYKQPNKMVYEEDGSGDFDAAASTNTELETDAAHYLIVDIAVSYILKISNQPQQKVVNLENEKI